MCGISGWFCWGDKRPAPATIRGLLLANMERGTSATGMAYLAEDNGIQVFKDKGPANKFIEALDPSVFEQAARSPRGLLHARATTKGSEDENANNHPVVGLGWLVVHNGSLSNDDDLWGFYKAKQGVERFAEVDTSAIPLVLSRGATIEESIRKLTQMGGSATIAAWSEQYRDQIVLGRFGHNDLHMFFDAAKNILYWSSAPSAGYVMSGVFMGKHKFLTMSRLADQHVLVLTPAGLDATRVFKLTQRPFFARRKVVSQYQPPNPAGSVGGTQARDASSGPQKTYEESLEQGRRLASAASSIVSPTTSTPGLASLARKERQINMKAGKDYVQVMFQAPHDSLMLSAKWTPMESIPQKPVPMSDVFAKVWWSLAGILHALDRETVVKEITKESGYGRWTLGKDKLGEHYMSFKAYKRTKAWWESIYHTRFEFPMEVPTDEHCELDDHMCWEHYDVQLQKSDKSSHMFLGFMCPWCGVWLSATRVSEMRQRCEFCCIRNRMEVIP